MWFVVGTLVSCLVLQYGALAALDSQCEQDGLCQPRPQQASDNLECHLVMAESTIPGGGWGVFSTIDRPEPMTPLSFGDLAIHVTDLNVTFQSAARRITQDYMWSPEQTGGFAEGNQVMVSLPGMGALANSLPDGANVLPSVPNIDSGGLLRTKSPGAGAITHYHNFTWFVSKPVNAGEEIFVDYGGYEWFRQREMSNVEDLRDNDYQRSVDWLLQNGHCLDNVQPGRSKVKDAGRGLFAARDIRPGATVLPVPVMAIADRRAFDIVREGPDGRSLAYSKQLLLNYCFGHKESSVLLFPYGPGFHLVNHARKKRANVRVKWASVPHNVTLLDLWAWQDPHSPTAPKFLLYLVATKSIRVGQEILLDYGRDWEEAWNRHVESWVPEDGNSNNYIPAYAMSGVKRLRTVSEAQVRPYPDNIVTSCFYYISDETKEARGNRVDSSTFVSLRWKETKDTFDFRNLRPCTILERNDKDNTYTVQVSNDDQGLGAGPVLTNVPKRAVLLTDKPYTTDQHLEGAFRHPVGVADGFWPEQWKD